TGGTKIQIVAPADNTVGASKSFPADSTLFASTIYPILHHQNPVYCARCHNPGAAAPQKPYFASDDVNEAYSEAQAKINIDSPELSRFYVRLHDESHNCWSDCAANAQQMLDAINAFANGVQPTQVDPTLTVSKALAMYDGTIASGGNRVETHQIARYFFKEGSGTIAHDTSGVDPAIDLNFSGSVTWSGGWGINIAAGGRAQATTGGSKKLSDRIKASGEFSIEAWVAPGNVAQNNAYIVSYSGGNNVSNFVLDQREYQYEVRTRSDKTTGANGPNGEPSLLTSDTAQFAQASLQHVVVTYDPVNGRKLYVNGVDTKTADPLHSGGNLSNWDDTFAFALGNEPGGTRQFLGLLKFVAIHDRALKPEEVQQNFAAGVGEKYFVLFNVSQLTNLSQAYVMFEVSQYDSYAYLFNKPTFISLDNTVKLGSIEIKGMRIGLNGHEALVGQAYSPLDVTVTDTNYSPETGQLLSTVGTVIGLEKGPTNDQFFLTFEKIGPTTSTHDYSDKTVVSTTPPADLVPRPDVGFRNFEKIDATMSKLTGVSRNTAQATYLQVQQQLPSIPDVDAFGSSNQMGIAQLGAAYCSSLINTSSLETAFFGSGLNLSASIDSTAQRNALINPIVTKFIGTGLKYQADTTAATTELNSLIDKLCAGGSCPATPVVAKAVCTAALSSAITTLE
ncbi:MAG: LamG domain-containing protein, partial [Steroidobacter sp.]